MSHKTELCLQVRPGLVMTPSLQLALKFLQVPALELRDLICREIEGNPVLELEEEDEAGPVPDEVASAEAGDISNAQEERPSEVEAPEDWNATEDGETVDGEAADWETGRGQAEESALPRGILESAGLNPFERATTARGRGLAEELLAQIRLLKESGERLGTAEYLIGCLDDRGYLGCALSEAAESLQVSTEIVKAALTLIQGCDPPGIGARDLRECLLLQLRARGGSDTPAFRIVNEGFDLLCRRRFTSILRTLNLSECELRDALVEIRRLHPHPGALVAAEEVRYIYPDLIVERVGSGYEVIMNDRAVPRLRISDSCRGLFAPEAGMDSGPARMRNEAARRYAQGRLRSARWVISAVDRRRRTMLRVMECILEEQRGFFEEGLSRLKPLTLARVAGRLGLHESTIARVVRSKYVQTPGGIYPLKFFFSTRLPTASGDDTSSGAVRQRIRALIAEESPELPMTDETIARVLSESGIRIARRTVAKYRNSLRIERAPLRRRRHVVALAAPRRHSGRSAS